MTNPIFELLESGDQALPLPLPKGSIPSESIEYQPKGATISDPSGGATVDAEARSAINSILAQLRAHGMIDS